jgi:hypothetical protein
VDSIDLWIGGLAENPAKQPLTPPMLGTTFQYVFMKQTLALQNGDRFYYLGRLAGTNLGEEIPAQKFTDIVRRNTPSSPLVATSSANGIMGMNSPGFGVSDCSFTDGSHCLLPSGSAICGAGTMSALPSPAGSGTILTHTGLDNVTWFYGSS